MGTEEEGFSEESGPWPPPPEPGPEPIQPEPEVIQGFVTYVSSFGGLTGRGVVSTDNGDTWR